MALMISPRVLHWAVELIKGEGKGDINELNADAWQYSYPDIGAQLEEFQFRSFEFDVYHDPQGGRYRMRAGPKLATMFGLSRSSELSSGPPYLHPPGWKVLHVPDFDYQSTCLTLEQCLRPIQEWSSRNRRHKPLFIRIEPKMFDPSKELGIPAALFIDSLLRGSPLSGPKELTRGLPIGQAELLDLEQIIQNIFNSTNGTPIITPEELTTLMGGPDLTLKEAIIDKRSWPLLSQVEGRIFFILIGHHHTYTQMYPENMKGALFFIEPRPADLNDAAIGPHTVFLQVADSNLRGPRATWDLQVVTMASEVSLWASRGYMVRAYADTNLLEARSNYTTRCSAINTAGAHFLQTDFPYPLAPTQFPSAYSCSGPQSLTLFNETRHRQG